MRLSEIEIDAIKKSFAEIKRANSVSGELFLFGSRTDDSKHGGDIDLLWICPISELKSVRGLKFEFSAKIQMYSDVQKIDVAVMAKDKIKLDPFYQAIQGDLIKLC